MSSLPPGNNPNARTLLLVVGIAAAIIVGALLVVAVAPSFSGGTSSTSPPESSRCSPPSFSVGPKVVSCAGVVENATPVSTLPVSVRAGSLGLLFVSYINFEAGGGAPVLITDSLGDSYSLLTTTGYALNHTEDLYAADIASSDASFVASVTWGGGKTPQGGSVAFVDVNNSTTASVDGVGWNTGVGATASVNLSTSQSGDLFLFGSAGRGVSGPYSPGSGESLVDTGTATSGPFEDGTGYGTFAVASTAKSVTLSANLNVATGWDAVGVAIATGPVPPAPPSSSVCTPPSTAVGPKIVGCAGVVGDLTPISTPAFHVAGESLDLVFVSYVNFEIGGGAPESVTDSSGDTYTLLTSTGSALNHTENLYAADVPYAGANFTVTVTFGGGLTVQGGSVAAVDVAGATTNSIDSFAWNTGDSGQANVIVTTHRSGDLFLLGTAGRGVSAPYSPGPAESLLDTGTNTSGPYADGTGYGTFSIASTRTNLTLNASLNVATGWDAIGVAVANESVAPPPVTSRCTPPATRVGPKIESCTGAVGNETPVTTLPVNFTAGSLNLVFVSYVNSEIGGGAPEWVTDSVGDAYSLLITTGFALNHTESLYGADVSTAATDVTVSVLFGGGVTLQGGSVATVDVGGANLRSVDNAVENTGPAGPANVTVTTSRSGNLFLLGTAGRGVSAPFSPGSGETLLDTGTADSGPFQDGTGYGTFAIASTATNLTLSANLNYSATSWDAIGVAISTVPLAAPSVVAHAGTVNNNSTVVTAPIEAAANSLVLVFVSYVNGEIGGGTPTSVVDSSGDSFNRLATTGTALNHTENLYAAHRAQANPGLVVSVSFGGGDTPQGGSVAVVDVGNATLYTIDAVGVTTGTGAYANLTLVANHTGDLYLYGTAGRGVSAPFSPGPGMTLLNTGTNTSGPYLDGTGYGSFMTTSAGTSAALSAELNVATGWDAIGVAIDP